MHMWENLSFTGVFMQLWGFHFSGVKRSWILNGTRIRTHLPTRDHVARGRHVWSLAKNAWFGSGLLKSTSSFAFGASFANLLLSERFDGGDEERSQARSLVRPRAGAYRYVGMPPCTLSPSFSLARALEKP